MTFYAVDFMCGIGGATRGFLDAGIQVLKGFDIDERCKETYEKNCEPAKFVQRDLYDLTVEEVMSEVESEDEDLIVFIACAPCQPFSKAGRGDEEEPKTQLILKFNEFVCDLKPDFVFVENVPGFEWRYPNIYRSFLKLYEDLNYNYQSKIINAKDYGIPQKRKRYIFFASKNLEIELPEKTHGPSRKPYVTVRETIRKYPPLKNGDANAEYHNHICCNLSELNIKRLQHTPQDGGSRKDWLEELQLECHKGKQGHTDVYGRMWWDKPAPTLTCRCISISNGRFAHPEQNRGISVREAAALQTFRDDFIFYEPKTNAAMHIGNAVPPLLAHHFAKKIIQTVKDCKYF